MRDYLHIDLAEQQVRREHFPASRLQELDVISLLAHCLSAERHQWSRSLARIR